MSWRRAGAVLALLTGFLGIVHLAMAGTLELAPDEAYYWTWSRNLALAYRDHPPITAWLVRAGTAVFGDVEIGVRFWFVAIGTALAPVAFSLSRAIGLRPRTSLLAAAAVGTSLLGSAASLLATPDTPLAFGWAVGLLGLARGASRPRSAGAWACVTIGTAVALLSKLTGMLFPLVALAWLWLAEAARPLRKTLAPDGALAAGAALAAPALITDLAASGGSAAFQLAHGLWSPGLGFAERAGNFGAYLAGQIGLLTPLIAVAVAVFLARRSRRDDTASLVWWAAVIPWSLFAAASWFAPPEPNWPGVAHLGAIVGTAWVIERAAGQEVRWAGRRWIAAALGLQVAVAGAVHVHVLRPLALPFAEPAREFEGPTDPAARLHGWRDLAAAVGRTRDPVAAGDYGIAAELSFYGVREVRQLRPGEPFDGWWIAPVRGPELPGQREIRPPAGCREVQVSADATDQTLAGPVAPVRVMRLICERVGG